MFHSAVPASYRPADRPTRGSGEGTVDDALGVGVSPPDDEPPDAHAPSVATPATSAAEAARRKGRVTDTDNMGTPRVRCGNSTITSFCGAAFDQDLEEQPFHPVDLRDLVDVHVGGETEGGLVLTGAIGGEEFLHHGHGATMVLDHVAQEELIEPLPACAAQLAHLLCGEHA